MTKYSFKDIFLGVLKTSILLVALEIISSALFPALGLVSFRPPFSVLVVLYIAFKINTSFVPFIILIIQNIHSIFSIEGWAVSTLIGVIIALSVKYFKDLLDFSTAISTIIVVQLSQLLWFLMLALFLSIKVGDFSNFFTVFLEFIPESIALSATSPWFFYLLDKLWISKNSASRA